MTDRMYNVLDAYETDDYLIGQYVGSILETLDINVLTKSIHADLWTSGNYIMCQDKSGRKYWLTIYDDEDGLNDDVKSFSCYSGTIDIVSEECPPISATQAQPFEWYFNRIFSDTGITLGINEISGMTRKLEFTSENATNAEMLQFVLNGFDNAEAQLDVKFDGSTPTELVLNVYKRIGEEQPQAILSDEDDSLTDLTRKGSLSELGTCLDLEGAEVDEKTVTLAGKYYEEKDAAGNILYYSPKNLTRIFSVKAHEDYYVKLPNKAHGEFDGYINRRYKSEAKTQDALWAEGLARLKKIDHAVVEYDAKGDISCGIGDNVQVVSHTMRPPVMVSARTTEYKFNDDDHSRNEYKFSNYVDLESNMDDLTSIINKIKDQIVYVVDQSVMYCLADQGNTAPVTGWTNVNPGAVKGKWLWTRTKIDYSNGTSSVSEVPTYSAINGEPGKPGTSPIITPNDDGTITILDVEGEKVTPDLTGPPTGVISQSTVPSAPYIGMLWQNTGTPAGYIKGCVYRWNGSKWELWTFSAVNIMAETFVGLTFQGVKFIGSNFTSNFDRQIVSGSPNWVKGTSVIENGSVKNTTTQYVKSTGAVINTGTNSLDPDALRTTINNPDGSNQSFAALTGGGLTLSSNLGGRFYGVLTADMLTKTPWINLPLNAGFQASEGRVPQYKIQYNVDGTRTILFRGQVTTTNASIPANCYFEKDREYFCATIPSAVRPAQTCFTYAPTGANVYVGGRLAAIAGSGSIQVLIPHANVNYIVLDSLSYIID
ncbi:hypothetical protein [Streptomyces sp. P17]|nr:hypothetical protein [Streptomyces sp. P17]MDT9700902.1 hypothetical protein [Streptomyces sp. P17]